MIKQLIKTTILVQITVLVFTLNPFMETAAASDSIGKVIFLKGSATVERSEGNVPAALDTGLLLEDAVATAGRSRMKMLFIDQSSLSLRQNSRAVLKKFLQRGQDGGLTVLELIDGSMRAAVGSNSYEVHTSTVVTSARGTVIDYETGSAGNRRYTTVTCLEGMVDVRSADPSITGSALLRAGMSITVFEGAALPYPKTADRGVNPAFTLSSELEVESTSGGTSLDINVVFPEPM